MKYLTKSLQVVQNKAARVVTRCGKRTPIRTLLKECGWLSIAQLESQCPKYLYSKLSNENNLPYRMRSTADMRIRLGQVETEEMGL